MERRRALAAAFLLLSCLAASGCSDSGIKYYNLGVDAARRDDLDEAIGYWRRSLEYNPGDPDTRYNLGPPTTSSSTPWGSPSRSRVTIRTRRKLTGIP